MSISCVEIDISNARTNQEGEISNISVRVTDGGEVSETVIWSNPAGIHRGFPPEDHLSVPVTDHGAIEISEDLCENIARKLNLDLDGRMLQEMDSTPKRRIFLPVRRSIYN